jgi:RimJ/RimL family protein N-acetyltransferase
VAVRPLQWGDFEPLVRQYLDLYEEVRSNPDLGISLFREPPTMGAEVEWFARLYRQVIEGEAVAMVAEEAGSARGLCTVRPRGPTVEGAHVGTLGILIERSYRGKGLGRALLRETLRRCRGRFEILELSVFATNLRARKLYEELGFRTYAILPRGLRRGDRAIDHLSMWLDLGTSGKAPDPASGNG